MKVGSFAFLAVSSIAWVGCGGDDTASSGDPPQGALSYYKDVEPIVREHCQSCHQEGGIAPFALTTYQDVKDTKSLILDQIDKGIMPPWGALETDECTPPLPWKNDNRLSEAELGALHQWSDDGAYEGDPADSTHEPIPTYGLSRVDREIMPAMPYVASGDSDDFRCFVMDPNLDTDAYMSGVQVTAGNPAVVHHALIFVDPTRASADLAGPDGSYPCFGGAMSSDEQTGNAQLQLIAGWVPGSPPFEADPGIATTLPAHSLIVMQVHYHPGGTVADPDQSKIDFKLESSPPTYELSTKLIGNFRGPNIFGGLLPGDDDTGGVPEFRIPANAPAHTESMEFAVPKKLAGQKLYGSGSHMHLVGTDERVAVRHADGSETCLVQTPRWDFSWQRPYYYDAAYDALPTIAEGDVLEVRCTYDNTMQNPALAAELARQNMSAPVDVFLGEQTTDEMCLAFVPLLSPFKAK